MERVSDKIRKMLLDEKFQTGLTLIAVGSSVEHPVLTTLLTSFKGIISLADELKLKWIIKGLASGLNQETYTNELATYIGSNDERAFHVSNMLRKAVLANSKIVCVLIGRILADHVYREADFDQDDIIILHALETATDDDLKTFRKMMNNINEDHIKGTSEYEYCIDWCLANRLLKNEENVIHDGYLSLDNGYIAKKSSYRLMEYLDEIKQEFRVT